MDLMAYVPGVSASSIQQEIEWREPVVKHTCEMPPKVDPLTKTIPGNSIWSRQRRWFLGTRLVSKTHPLARWCLKSTRAIDYEIGRHLECYPYMIHPFSAFRIFWESVMTLFIVAALLITPIFLAFYFDEYEKWCVFDQAINAVFICDITSRFLTGHHDPRTQLIVLDPRVVARAYIKIIQTLIPLIDSLTSNYLRGLFVADALSVLPLRYLIVSLESTWYLTSLNLLKILWIRIVIVYSRRLYYVYRINFHLYKITKMGVIIVITVHWAACLEYYLPLAVAKITEPSVESWIRSPYMAKRETKLKIYITCVNRAIIALVGSAHYLNMITPEDIALNLILTVIGFLGFIYLLTRFWQLMTTLHLTRVKHLRLIQELRQYMRYKELPRSLQQRLLTYYNYRNKRGIERDKKIIGHVSPYLQQELLSHKYQRLLNNVELFEHLPQPVVTHLLGAIRSEIFMPNDELIKAGMQCDALFFVASGTVAVYNVAGKEMRHLEDGAYFGELSLLIEGEPWIGSIIAVESCEMYVLTRADLQQALPYPDILAQLQKIALARMQLKPPLEEADASSMLSLFRNMSNINFPRSD